ALAMDVQPRAPQHGTRRHHPNAETGTCRLAPLLVSVENGGITIRSILLEFNAPRDLASREFPELASEYWKLRVRLTRRAESHRRYEANQAFLRFTATSLDHCKECLAKQVVEASACTRAYAENLVRGRLASGTYTRLP